MPGHLTALYPIPEGCVISRTVHCDHALPHFQGRLPPGCIYEGKILEFITSSFLFVSGYPLHVRTKQSVVHMWELRASTSASYSPSVPADKLDENKKSIRQMPAAQRSELQAFWMVQQWLLKAVTEKPSKRRKL